MQPYEILRFAQDDSSNVARGLAFALHQRFEDYPSARLAPFVREDEGDKEG
jgi:hypothetical protein